MKEIYKEGEYKLDIIDESEKPKDLFETVQAWNEGNCVNMSFAKRPHFGRDTSLEEDMIELKKKYKNTPNEVLVQHMIDSLIIFNHNRKNIGDKYPTKQPTVNIELPDVVTLTS